MLVASALDEITGGIVDAAYKLHTGLKPSASPRLRVNRLLSGRKKGPAASSNAAGGRGSIGRLVGRPCRR